MSEVARLKARAATALGGCFACATAAAHGCRLPGDPETLELADLPCLVEDLRSASSAPTSAGGDTRTRAQGRAGGDAEDISIRDLTGPDVGVEMQKLLERDGQICDRRRPLVTIVDLRSIMTRKVRHPHPARHQPRAERHRSRGFSDLRRAR
jgi:hypothetical protein